MTRRVSPIQAIRAEIDALFTADRDLVEVLEDVARLGARLIIQTAVEAEVEAFLGRARYQRAATVTAADSEKEDVVVRPGHRNGHCPTTIKTTSGPITIARPKLRGTTEKFASRLFGTGVTRTHALETLVIASFVRGLSVRDVEGALADALGPEAALSKSTVSTICQAIVAEYDAWCRRDLTGIELDYLFLDASHFKMHQASSRAEPILAAWGITTDGRPVFVGLDAAGAGRSARSAPRPGAGRACSPCHGCTPFTVSSRAAGCGWNSTFCHHRNLGRALRVILPTGSVTFAEDRRRHMRCQREVVSPSALRTCP
ncbi:transposase [Nonomuraea sp. NPDC049480]|uniref:transposase n=1 Tax=Nonomuraea sp. NPDC049480 TaxID=3364353 RepID=UPI0037887B1A